MDWVEKQAWAEREHGLRSGATGVEEREDLRLAGIAGASWAAGLAAAMAGNGRASAELLRRAADEYVTSWHAAPPQSWGRPIAVLRCRLLAGEGTRARPEAEAALLEGAPEAAGPIAAYCATLAFLVLELDDEAAVQAERAVGEGLEPVAVAEALGALARRDSEELDRARREVLRSFEDRDAFLEEVPVADTVLVLDALASTRGLELPRLTSPLLPARDSFEAR